MIVSTTTAIDRHPVTEYVGVDVDYESIQIGQGGSMLMVSASGTDSGCFNLPCRHSPVVKDVTGETTRRAI